MVNANEWLNENIPKNQRAQTTGLYIYSQYRGGYNINQGPPNYQFYNTTLEGELDLNDFVNLQQLNIGSVGQDQDQQQKITHLKIDK
ncbi:20312_t:CDS:1, partial [Dentiscutata erythropus]